MKEDNETKKEDLSDEVLKNKDKKEDKLSLCEEQRDEYLELSKRLKADFVNLKKETGEQFLKMKDIVGEDIILKILPVLDSLNLSLKHTPEDLKENNWVKGMLGVRGQFEGILKSLGVEKIKTVGEDFDPALHEAISQEKSDKKEGVILEELQEGYKLNNKIIRAAKVKVSK